MRIKFLFIVITLVTLISCKNESNKDDSKNDSISNVNIDKDLLKISFDLIVKENDNMHLYYTQDGTINFDEKNSIWSEVKGNENIQTVTFKLPKDVLPTHLRVDLGYGKNEKQSDVNLKNFKIEYLDKKFEAKDTMIFNYFYENKDNTVRVPKTAILKRKDKTQDSGPMLYPHTTLTDELNKIVK